jgi:hypothetical protein
VPRYEWNSSKARNGRSSCGGGIKCTMLLIGTLLNHIQMTTEEISLNLHITATTQNETLTWTCAIISPVTHISLWRCSQS